MVKVIDLLATKTKQARQSIEEFWNKAFIQGTLLSGSAFLAFYNQPREIGAQVEVSF